MALMTSTNTSAPMRICSCWPDCRWPMSGRLPLGAFGFFFLAGVGATEASLSLPKGSFIEPSFIAMWSLLSQELAVATDDRQVDELRAGVVGRRIADEKSA